MKAIFRGKERGDLCRDSRFAERVERKANPNRIGRNKSDDQREDNDARVGLKRGEPNLRSRCVERDEGDVGCQKNDEERKGRPENLLVPIWSQGVRIAAFPQIGNLKADHQNQRDRDQGEQDDARHEPIPREAVYLRIRRRNQRNRLNGKINQKDDADQA